MRFILHIGQHKTGSKALQSALYAQRRFLAQHGFHYVVPARARRLRPYEMNHHGLFVLLRAALEARASGGEAVAPVRRYLQRFGATAAVVARTAILSCEDLFDMHTAHEETYSQQRIAAATRILAEAFGSLGADVRIICYLRRQDHLLGAHYAQFIKGPGCQSAEIGQYARLAAPRLCHDRILDDWESAFGRETIRVRPYERQAMPAGIVGAFFTHELGIDAPAAASPFRHDPEATNRSPARRYIDYIRLLNRRACRGAAVLPRAQILEAAFRDAGQGPSGIAAYLSPSQRAALLAPHQQGNRRIARRHRLGDTLFLEPDPHPADPWSPPSRPDLAQLLALEARVRCCHRHQPAWLRPLAMLRRRLVPRLVWIVPARAQAEDLALAADLFAGIAGSPHLESRIQPHLPEQVGRCRMHLLVGAAAIEALATARRLPRRGRRPRTLLLIGSDGWTEEDARRLEGCVAALDAVICADRELRDALTARLPCLRVIRLEPQGSSQRPDPSILAAFSLVRERR